MASMRISPMPSLYSSTFQKKPFWSLNSSSSVSLRSNSAKLISLRRSSIPLSSISAQKRNLSVMACYASQTGSQKLKYPDLGVIFSGVMLFGSICGAIWLNIFRTHMWGGGESFLRNVLASMETVYLNRNPTGKAILELVCSSGEDRICYDHFAFRTFGVNGYGIDSIAKFFLDFGYTTMEELRFPAKKLKALWFSPPKSSILDSGSRTSGPLPRIFISELLVDQMSPEAQKIIRKYTDLSGNGNQHAALASALGSLTWEKPLYSEFKQLARESEYAAWTLVNGYATNHVTISAHRLKSHLRDIKNLNHFIEESGYKLNSEGGILKVSPDGLLLQSSTVADSMSFTFSDGNSDSVPCSYIEFAERLVLPQYENLPENEVKEHNRRDGFEVGNADKIFESTYKEQLTRKVA